MPKKKAPPLAHEFCGRYVFVTSHDSLYDRLTGNLITAAAAARRHAHEVEGDETVQHALFKGPNAVDKVDEITFWPRRPELVEEDGVRKLNRWSPLTLEPREGSVRPFLRHVARIVDGDETALNYVLDYYAHLVQRPDQKIRAALLFIGRPGTGKNILADVAVQMVGRKNAKSVAANQLASDFNGWIEASVLTVVDELVSDNSRSTAARLKSWITEDRVWVGLPARPRDLGVPAPGRGRAGGGGAARRGRSPRRDTIDDH